MTSERKWVVYRCWAGQASTMVPQPTNHRFRTRRAAEDCAERLTIGMAQQSPGTWYEVRESVTS